MFSSILILGLISIGIGFTIFPLYKDKGLESLIMSMVFGVCVFPILGIVLSFLNLLSLNFLLVLFTIIFFCQFNKNYYNIKFELDYRVFVVIFFSLLMFGVFLYGGVNQVWLEDGDPNGHAVAASYIAHYKTAVKPADLFIARYMEPYPLGYQIWTGLLSQDGFDVVFTLMWFTYFIISVGYIAMYFLTLSVFGCRDRALAAALILMALPTFSTRFIFSQPFALTLIIVAMYFISKAMKDRKFGLSAGFVIGALLLTHPTSAIVLAVFMGIWISVEFLYERKIQYGVIFSGIVGVVVALPWWLHMYAKYGWDKILIQLNLIRLGETAFGLTDPTLKFYTLTDFIVSPINNTIDNMTGIGVGMFILLLLAIYGVVVGRDKNRVIFTAMTIFGIAAVFSNWLPISFVPTRMWVYMSIPLAIILAQPLVVLLKGNDFGKAVALMLIGIILLTSVSPKVFITIQPWGNSRFNSAEEYSLLMYLRTLPVQTKVMDPCMYERVWGVNLWDDPLDKEAILVRNVNTNTSIYGWDSEGWVGAGDPNDAYIFSQGVNKTYAFLKDNDYNYIIVGSKCIKNNMITEDAFQNIVKSGLFENVFAVNGEYVFRLK